MHQREELGFLSFGFEWIGIVFAVASFVFQNSSLSFICQSFVVIDFAVRIYLHFHSLL